MSKSDEKEPVCFCCGVAITKSMVDNQEGKDYARYYCGESCVKQSESKGESQPAKKENDEK